MALLDKKTGESTGTEEVCCDKDECNRPDTTLEGLLALKPHFDPDSGQGIGDRRQRSQLSDGASATLLMSRERADRLGIPYKLVFRGFAVAGCEPDEMGIGPVFAVPKLLKRHGLKVDDIDLWELNEAFAVQVVYCRDRLGIPGEAERQRRLDRHRPPVRHDRIADGRHARQRDGAPAKVAVRRRDHVHRRRTRRRGLVRSRPLIPVSKLR